MIHVHCHVNDLDVEILASLTDNAIQRKCDITDQNLPAILWREDHIQSEVKPYVDHGGVLSAPCGVH
jgi:hypothetical protein